nr:uncharacterized protein LOC129383932 [Dermacentor andersoni]
MGVRNPDWTPGSLFVLLARLTAGNRRTQVFIQFRPPKAFLCLAQGSSMADVASSGVSWIVSADQARDRRTLFGLSHSPHALSSQLAQSGGGDEAAKEFLSTADQLYGDAGLSAIGVMGLVRKVMDFTHEPKLVAWFQALSVFASRITNGTVFLGLRLNDKGEDLASKDKLAKDVFETVKKMKVNLLVLVTHNVRDMEQSSCISEPVSSWSSKAYKNNERLALEQIFKFLVAGLRERTTIEVTLSSTLVLVSFHMKKPVSKPVEFGEPCVRNYRMHMERYCVDALPNVQIDDDSLSAVGFHGDTLFSFETPESIEKKMRRFVTPLDDVVFHRVGWAFFDLAFEIYDEASCPSNGSVTMSKFARVAVAKPILTENRERTFNK